MLQEPHSKLSKVSQTFHSHVESFEQSQGGLVIHRLNLDWEGSKGNRQSRKKWRLIKLSELGKKLCKYEVHKIKWLSHLSNRASKKSAEFFLDLNLTRTSFKTCSSFRHLINYFKPHRLCHRLQWRQRKVKKIYILIFWELQLHLFL